VDGIELLFPTLSLHASLNFSTITAYRSICMLIFVIIDILEGVSPIIIIVNSSLFERYTEVSIIVILVNAIIFIVIGILREDPLSTGMLYVFFQKIRSLFVSFSIP
jgi:hypothetical protein